MAKYGTAYLWKTLVNGLPVAALLLVTTRVSVGLALAYAFAFTVLAYLIGDFLILPPFGNVVATLADGGLAFVTVFSLRAYDVYIDYTHAVLVAAAVMLIEGLYFHGFLWSHVFQQRAGA